MESIGARQETQSPSHGRSDYFEEHVRSRLYGRIHDLRVFVHKDGVVLAGRAPSYYTKQLAQTAVMRITNLPIIANEIEVM